jgi:hypothetical protein
MDHQPGEQTAAGQAAKIDPKHAPGATTEPTAGAKPIVLYCDLAVDPAREQEMLDIYHHQFKPVAEKFEGFIDLKIVKIRKVLQGGPAPASGINYRFQLTYQSEELRQRWVASDVHAKYWPMIEETLADKNYLVILTDVV